MFQKQLMNSAGEPVTLKPGDRVMFEWSVTGVCVSVFPHGKFQTYFFGNKIGRTDSHLVACTVPHELFDHFCEAIMALLSSLGTGQGYVRKHPSSAQPNARCYELR